MKRLSKIFIFIFAFILGVNVVSAASGYSVSSNSSTVIVGNTVKVTVKVSSDDLGAWAYCISYDSSVLKLTASTADASTCVKTGYVSSPSQKSSTETFTFKALKSGSTKVSVKNAAIYSYKNESQIGGISIGSTTIKCMTQSELEATYSTNAYLSSISVTGTNITGDIANYDLNPAFDKETKEYVVNVPNEVEKANIAFKKADGTASVSGGGDVNLNEGSNSFELVVTAQKGNQLTYKVVIVREELDPITVTLDGKEYTIIRRADALDTYIGYSASTVTYNETEIPALYSDLIDYTIVGVKDSDGNKKMYIFKDGKFTKEYVEYSYGDITFTPLDIIDEEKFKYEVKDNKFIINDNYYIAYGLDTSTNEKSYYLFNKKDGSFIVYDGSIEKVLSEKEEVYKYIIYGLIGFSALLLLIVLFGKKGSKTKKEKPIKIKEINDSEIEEDIEEEYVEENIKAEAVEETPNVEEDEEYVEDLPPVKETKRGRRKKVEEEPVVTKIPEEVEEEIIEEIHEDEIDKTNELDIDEDTIEETPMVDKKALKKQKAEEKRKAKDERKKAKKEAKANKKKLDEFDW